MDPRNFLSGPTTTGLRSADAGLLITRVIGGLALLLAHGLGKLPPGEGFIRRVGAMGLPAPELLAWGATLAEVGGAVLLVLGLLTRPAAAFVAVHFVIVTFVAHAGDPFDRREKAVLFLAIALLHAFAGPGRYSLDAILFRRRSAP